MSVKYEIWYLCMAFLVSIGAAGKVISQVTNSCAVFFFSAAPSGPPTSVSVTSTSINITVQWEAVDCIHRNGDITGYSVRYGVVGSGSTQTVNVSEGSVTEATISNVMSSTTYSIQVAAVNSAGIGVYSDLLPVYTGSECPDDSYVLYTYSNIHESHAYEGFV